LTITLALAVVSLPGAAAVKGNKGTIKVHDDEAVEPPTRNQPHVSCDFWIEGFKMSDDSGWLTFFSWPPTGNKTVATPTGDDLNWTANSGNARAGWHFLNGPYQLPPGHYRVEAYVTEGHPGADDHFAKAKTFWVDECGGGVVPPQGGNETPCPANVSATAGPDGIALSWDAVENATGYVVYRNGVWLANATGTSYLDADVEAGVTYSYRVTAIVGGVESEGCESVEATAVPFFGPIAGGLALAGLVGAFVVMRRKA
jgi:hypothetical protein